MCSKMNHFLTQNLLLTQESGHYFQLVRFVAHLLYHSLFLQPTAWSKQRLNLKKFYKSRPNQRATNTWAPPYSRKSSSIFFSYERVISQLTIHSAAATGHLYIRWSILKTKIIQTRRKPQKEAFTYPAKKMTPKQVKNGTGAKGQCHYFHSYFSLFTQRLTLV